MFMTRLRLSASTCKAISAPTRFERLHLEVGRTHPGFDRPEGMLDGFAPLAHLLRMRVEPPLDGLEDFFVFPAGNPALLARGAGQLDRAVLADAG